MDLGHRWNIQKGLQRFGFLFQAASSIETTAILHFRSSRGHGAPADGNDTRGAGSEATLWAIGVLEWNVGAGFLKLK